MSLVNHRRDAARARFVRAGGRPAKCLHIGIVNNMRDAALRATERQFRMLLAEAAGPVPLRLSLYVLPEIPRSDEDARWIDANYSPLDDLWRGRLDGLIVTGTEPSAPELFLEPYWQSLATLIDWADRNTRSTIWSCLAAHAAVLHLDGIPRRLLPEKLHGIYEFEKMAGEPLANSLTAGIPDRLQMPHSRWNDVPGTSGRSLEDLGYCILTRSDEAGIDAFLKQQNSLFVFFQGHPEYETDTLLLEHRRDVRRFLKGDRNDYPTLPSGYFDEKSEAALRRFRERAVSDPHEDLLLDFPRSVVTNRVNNVWHASAITLYRNWLSYLWECGSQQRTIQRQNGREAVRTDAGRPQT